MQRAQVPGGMADPVGQCRAVQIDALASVNLGLAITWDSRNWRRQPNNCCGDNPCRLATPETDSPLVTISATIRALSSSLNDRRRPAPVKTSSR